MIRWTVLLGLVGAGCTKKESVPSESVEKPPAEMGARATKPEAPTPKPGAPVEIEATSTKVSSDLVFTFLQPATDVRVEVWGTRGLKVKADKVHARWDGVKERQTLTAKHEGEGVLAVRVVGVFGGKEQDVVRSFTIGTVEPTHVPTEIIGGEKVKGWEATSK